MPKNDFTCDCDAIHRELVETVLAQMPGEGFFVRLSGFYKLLADPTRCKLLCALEKQELCVCDLACILSMTKSAVSHQLARLREQGTVKCRRVGKEVYYSLDDHHVAQLLAATMTHICHKEAASL